MSDLVQSLITGFFTSIILLLLVYFFWKLYDRPSKKQIELEEETREKHKEERMWLAIEQGLEKEREQVEALALIERRKAEMRARAQPPAAGIMQGALATLDAPTEGENYLDRFKPNTDQIEEILVDEITESEQVDDSDVLLAPELIAVRQDEGEHQETITGGLLSIDNISNNESPETEELGTGKLIEDSKSVSGTESRILPREAEEDGTDVDWNRQHESDDDSWAVGW
ncbi:MAG: hypothetical protein VXY53_03535 [Candidatus Thermoplasmatota archaeon]|nr:hypothetical protein [Candidatus Thermoplasmatota archaeon]